LGLPGELVDILLDDIGPLVTAGQAAKAEPVLVLVLVLVFVPVAVPTAIVHPGDHVVNGLLGSGIPVRDVCQAEQVMA